MKSHALEYARQGVKVFPVHTPHDGKCSCGHDDCTNPGKHPRTAHGFSDATTDLSQIEAWWDLWPDANIGAMTDSFLVVDGDSPEAIFYAQTQGLGSTYNVVRGDHRHYYYRQPVPPLPRMSGQSAIFPKLDILGLGGYVILAPSIHVSGQIYTASEPFNIENLGDCPDWIARDVRAKRSEREKIHGEEITPIISGGRNTALASLAGTIRNAGADEETILITLLSYNLKRCVPPLSNQEVATIAKSIARYDTPDLAAHNGTIFFSDSSVQKDGLILPIITNGTASDWIADIFAGKIVFDKTNSDGRGEFYIKKSCYWEPCLGLKDKGRRTLERLIEKEHKNFQKMKNLDDGIKDIIEKNYSRAIARVRSTGFLNSTIELLQERLLVPKISWNSSQNALPCIDKIVDFSGEFPIVREAKDDEFFRSPIPCKAQDVIDAPSPYLFESFIQSLFYDTDTRETALQCLSLCISGVPSKTAQIWHNSGGDGGKNSLFDLMGLLFPGRIVMIKSSVIMAKGDASERRFGEAECEGRGGIFFDELSAEIDINQIKKLTGLSEISAERKGKDPFTFRQTWALAMLCNRLPRFRPAEDSAFISRLLILPFSSVFYSNEDSKFLKIKMGVSEAQLKPAMDKTSMLNALVNERPGIVRALISAWIRCRDQFGGIPYKSLECKQAAEKYRIENDDVERFFDECFERADSFQSVTYEKIREAWIEFTGNSRFEGMKWLISEILKKFTFVKRGNSNGVRSLKGIALRPDAIQEKEF